jgi:hypothetical protein
VTSFNIAAACVTELSGCDYCAEVEIQRTEGEGEMMDGNIFNSSGAHVAIVRGPTIFDLKGRKLYDLRGARDRWCNMRDEFASKSFLAVTVAGLFLLCSGLVAFAFT